MASSLVYDWKAVTLRGRLVVKVLAPIPRDQIKRDAWQWDAGAGRYRYKPTADRKLGKLVPDDRIRRVHARALRAEAREMQRAAERFVARKMTLVEFQTAMANRSAMMHLQSRMLAVGGRAQMTPHHYDAVRALWGSDMQYLDRFGQQIARGELSAARIVERAQLYADSASQRNAYEEGRLYADALAGKAWEMWVLGAADHCPGCIEQSLRGKVPLGELPAIGSQNCNGACKCSKERS